MSRQEVYDKCTMIIEGAECLGWEKVDGKNAFVRSDEMKPFKYKEPLLPKEAIDAIIDCAVEEAVKMLKGEGCE